MNKEIEKIKPSGIFTNYIYKAIPLAFDESMSYYETLCGILSILKTQEQVINNNADLLAELENYVKNYFDNLDVQEEINNKLDEMVEDGTLQEIITQYLQINGVLGFNTVNDLVNATNIINGSICKTIGLNTYNDGKGEFYKIRTVTSGDVVDGVNIIALNISNTLIAEKIPNYYINEINNELDEIETKLTIKDKILVIGDSISTNPPTSTPLWHTIVGNQLNCDVLNYAVSGGGFTVGTTFISQATSANTAITDKSKIKYIYVEGIINDLAYQTTPTDIKNAQRTLFNYLKTNFPNSKIIYVTDNVRLNYLYTEEIIKNNIAITQECGIEFIDARKYLVFNHDFYQEDDVHLTALGSATLASIVLGNQRNLFATYSNVNTSNITITSTGTSAPNLNSQSVTMNENKLSMNIILDTIYAGLVLIQLPPGLGIYKYAHCSVRCDSGDQAGVNYNTIVTSGGNIRINFPNNTGSAYVYLETELY